MRRLDLGARPEPKPVPPDRAWHEMLSRLEAEDAERRLDAMERALNGEEQ